MQEALGSPETPKKYHFWDKAAEKIFWTFLRKKEIITFFCSKVFVLLSKFQGSCTLLGGEPRGFFCRLSDLQPWLFMNLQTMFFPPTRFSPANCCESCLVQFPLLYLAFFITFLAASFRTLGLPVRFLSSKPSFFDDHFTTQRLDFSNFLAISFTNKPVVLSINAWDLR